MIIRRLDRRRPKEPLADALLSLASSLTEAASPEAALDALARGLAARDVSYALLTSEAGTGLRVDRATLPFVAGVWGRELHLPKLALVPSRGRPAVLEASDAFSIEGEGSLLSAPAAGKVIAAPAGSDAVLCLALTNAGDAERSAVWTLAMQLGAALRLGTPDTENAAPSGRDIALFHDLTRRLSYTLSDDDVIRAGIDALATSLPVETAASAICRGGADAVTVFGAASGARETASAALEAFRTLTGDKHTSCQELPFDLAALPAAGDAKRGASSSLIDAPLIVEGQVAGLLRIATTDAPDEGRDALFYTVANQLSLALERSGVQRRAERAQLASLAESLGDGIVLVDASLRVTSMNSAARELLGEIDEASSLTDTALAAVAQEALSSSRPTAPSELPAPTDGAARRYLVAMAAPLAGSPEGSAAVVIVRDVTEERLMQERLLQSEKMVSVGQLVSGVAHELNNPLTGIMGFAQLLQARDLDKRTLSDLELIFVEAERASKIVQNLLSFARRTRADKELSDLNTLLERVLELRNYDLTVKSIEVVRELDPKLPQTMVDPDQIQQVFLNLIINAEHAMISSNGKGALTVRSQREGDSVQVSLQDDGPGMEPETLRRIFDPFFTTKQAGEGTGLGLTISYGIIDEHGGRIWAESQPGRGTTFTIELPIVEGAGRAQPQPSNEPDVAVTGVSVLVVDDEKSIRRLLSGILEMDGHRVDTAGNGEEALDKIARERYDVIITDIKMPDMDGPSLYRRLVRLDPILAARTVFITGDTVSPDTRRFLEDVPNPCLAKPFRVREVRETIARLLDD